MKILKVILLIFLVAKSTLGLSTSIVNTSCCTDKQEIVEDSNQDEDEKGCCDSAVCDCLCCGHIFTFNSLSVPKANLMALLVVKTQATSSFYAFDCAKGIWQPPRLV